MPSGDFGNGYKLLVMKVESMLGKGHTTFTRITIFVITSTDLPIANLAVCLGYLYFYSTDLLRTQDSPRQEHHVGRKWQSSLVLWIHFVGTSGAVEFMNDHSSTCDIMIGATIIHKFLIELLQVSSLDVVRRSYLKNASYDVQLKIALKVCWMYQAKS